MQYQWNDFFPNMSLEAFLTSIIGESMMHSRTRLSNPREILSWEKINTLLRSENPNSARVRISKNGTVLSAEEYCMAVRDKRSLRYIDPVQLYHQMESGAVLIIDSIHEVCPQINDLAGFFSTILREDVQVNCYIGGKNSAGFDLH